MKQAESTEGKYNIIIPWHAHTARDTVVAWSVLCLFVLLFVSLLGGLSHCL